MNKLLGKTIVDLKLADYIPRTVESYAYHSKKGAYDHHELTQ